MNRRNTFSVLNHATAIVPYGLAALLMIAAGCSKVTPQPQPQLAGDSTVDGGDVATASTQDASTNSPGDGSSDATPSAVDQPGTPKPAEKVPGNEIPVIPDAPKTLGTLAEAAAKPAVRSVAYGIGVRNFREVKATFIALTEVTTPSAVLAAVIADNVPSLGKDNDVTDFGSAVQAATFKLAAGYCNDLVTQAGLAAARTRIFGGVDVALVPTTEMTTTKIEALSAALIENFWNRSREKIPDPVAAKQILAALAMRLLAGESMTNVATTRKVVIGMCTPMLAGSTVGIL